MWRILYRLGIPLAGLGIAGAGIAAAIEAYLEGTSAAPFYRVTNCIAIGIAIAVAAIAIILLIEGLPQAAGVVALVGVGLVVLNYIVVLVYTIVYWTIQFFKHYYIEFFIAVGSAYSLIGIIYCIAKGKKIKSIINDNMDVCWRNVNAPSQNNASSSSTTTPTH